eukprot:3270826-Rhodomonas_salina.2
MGQQRAEWEGRGGGRRGARPHTWHARTRATVPLPPSSLLLPMRAPSLSCACLACVETGVRVFGAGGKGG